MLNKEAKIQKEDKVKLLITTFALAVFILFVVNVFFLLLYISQNINEPTFQTINLSFRERYLIVNEEEVGFSIFVNLYGLLFIWFLMTYHTLKAIKKPFISVFF